MGIELVSRYVDAYERTVRPEILSRRGIDVLAERLEQSRRLRETIIKLRLVKFPRALIRQVERLDGDLPRPVLSLVLPARLSPSKRARYVAAAQVVIFLDGKDADQARYCEAAVAAARRRPTSKFGVDADFEVCQLSELGRFTRGRKLYAYVNGRTHQAAGAATARSLRKLAMTAGTAQYPPIASTIHVWEQPRRLRADEELSN